ncbi:hypothetical protein [Paenibacillus nasutitermitis]|uniref:Uncharacterized protein n=1 Tax=Paenibacillus nasutitermitis TaxID=1652958 RepID=A0A916ZH23_9BACL|nr:hypothetical protein [Paenibacillus nasutitermitis]GGD98001.1 hypothetical protein GCM10010911_66010 [Paenibacillus nasutitermitis]
MNRYVIQMIASAACILIPVFGVLYGLWDSSRPKTGPVGDGNTSPSLIQLIPLISTFIMGTINFPIAIIRYKKHKQMSDDQ